MAVSNLFFFGMGAGDSNCNRKIAKGGKSRINQWSVLYYLWNWRSIDYHMVTGTERIMAVFIFGSLCFCGRMDCRASDSENLS